MNGKKQEYLDISKDLEFKAFDVLNFKDHKKLKKFKSVLDIIKFLKKQKFETVDTKDDVNIENEIFEEPFRGKYDYPTDGIVFRLKSLRNIVKYNPILIGEKNPTSNFHTFAFKWKS
ncbi:hypothetical protein AB834_00340 [PVC group bacterium (ex Bugula neritina AB1)]|nr:hypothetical protein AB834_00340 [PVC group bacterium (ex Bugula neritina AB1)]